MGERREREAQRRPRDAESLRELDLGDALARGERAVEDELSQAQLGLHSLDPAPSPRGIGGSILHARQRYKSIDRPIIASIACRKERTLNICDRIIVLEFGKVIAAGPPDEVRRDPRVVTAYLGERRGPGGRRCRRRARPGGGREDMSAPVLELEGLTAGYDSAAVIRDIHLDVAPGEIVALLGANGAGKTTTLRAVSGLVRPMDGVIRFQGQDLQRVQPSARAKLGIAHVPENRGLFFGLTVAEHFRLGYRGERLDADVAYRYFPALTELRDRRCGLLSGGEQQMLAVGRALARHPRLLLLDELSLGLAPVIVEGLLPVVREYAEESGCGVVLVEQHIELALTIADRGYVLAHGETVLQGQADHLRTNHDLLISSYFGEHTELFAGKEP